MLRLFRLTRSLAAFARRGNSVSRRPGQRSFSGPSQQTLGARHAWERMTCTAHAFRAQPLRAYAAAASFA